MKQKTKWEIAQRDAEHIVEIIEPHCKRIEIVGSLRRLSPEVGDIEILAAPVFIPDMFGQTTPELHELNGIAWTEIETVAAVEKDGPKYKKLRLDTGLGVDVFICTPPAQWGVLKVIRTGPADFSQKFVTHKEMGGLLPAHMTVRNGAIWIGDEAQETPEEEDVFRLIGIQYIDPQKRK